MQQDYIIFNFLEKDENIYHRHTDWMMSSQENVAARGHKKNFPE